MSRNPTVCLFSKAIIFALIRFGGLDMRPSEPVDIRFSNTSFLVNFSLVNYFVILAEPAFSLLNNLVISLKKYIEIYHTVHGKKFDFVKL